MKRRKPRHVKPWKTLRKMVLVTHINHRTLHVAGSDKKLHYVPQLATRDVHLQDVLMLECSTSWLANICHCDMCDGRAWKIAF